MSFVILLFTAAYFAFVNWAAYRAFANDKQYAIDKEQRTPEVELLKWARIGGWGGAKYAQQKLRHKSYKEPFGSQLNEIGRLQAMVAGTVVIILCYLALAPSAPRLKQTAQIAAPAPQPDPVPPLKSLRPPVGYRTGL